MTTTLASTSTLTAHLSHLQKHSRFASSSKVCIKYHIQTHCYFSLLPVDARSLLRANMKVFTFSPFPLPTPALVFVAQIPFFNLGSFQSPTALVSILPLTQLPTKTDLLTLVSSILSNGGSSLGF